MGKLNFTKDGIRRLADLLRDQMENDFPKVTVGELVNRLAAIGYDTDISRVSRLRNGTRAEPSAALIWAIAKLEYLKHPSGQPYSHDEILRLMTEQSVPQKLSIIGDKTPNAAPVNLIRAKMREMKRSTESFARFCDIPLDRLNEILKGDVPDWTEFLNLGRVLFEDKNPAPLISLYPLAGDPIVTSAHKPRNVEKTD